VPTLTSYLNGMSAGMGGGNPTPEKRGQVNGWSAAAVRRHTRWLYSVDSDADLGRGLAVTLTVRDIPGSSGEFHAVRRALLRHLERAGLVASHWVIEWTARRRPHLHMALYWSAGTSDDEMRRLAHVTVDAWLSRASQWGSGHQGQHVASIDGALGWLQYLSKHAARGAAHYQRQGKPDGWETTGRLWGHSGEWPTVDPMTLDVSRATYWRLRRLVRSWRVADARQAIGVARTAAEARAARRRLVSARTMLSCDSRNLSEVRGISEWISEGTMMQLVGLLADQGHPVVQR
jgi:hypothetical protein